jgi:hypothetical protein
LLADPHGLRVQSGEVARAKRIIAEGGGGRKGEEGARDAAELPINGKGEGTRGSPKSRLGRFVSAFSDTPHGCPTRGESRDEGNGYEAGQEGGESGSAGCADVVPRRTVRRFSR